MNNLCNQVLIILITIEIEILIFFFKKKGTLMHLN